MSLPDKVVPISSAPHPMRSEASRPIANAPGLQPEAIQGLEPSYPGTLTTEMRALLQSTGGLWAHGFGTIDFTGRWHPEESIAVLRPSLTLAIDDEGRRWIGETSRSAGLPGPIWCVLPEPAVAVYVSDHLGSFLSKVRDSQHPHHRDKWLRDLHKQAHGVWAHRHALAQESYQVCSQDPWVRGWLATLPIDAHIYDLRSPSAMRGWPYGLAGPDGRFYRCGRLPVFAVATTPTANRWRQHMAHIADTGQIRWPAAAGALAA